MNYTASEVKNPEEIHRVETTDDTMTGRGGLILFVKYLSALNIYPLLFSFFGHYRKSSKGTPIIDIFKQLFCFFVDGTSSHLVYFDTLKRDEGYAAILETTSGKMLSSHAVKRFFRCFSRVCSIPFRAMLRRMFIWRLHESRPSVIELCVDSMVMNNDNASKREGVSPTYKKVKGFHPLNLIWDGKIIDTIFRGGKKHCNHGDTVIKMLMGCIRLIRKEYDEDVPIIVRLDSGFFDQDILLELDCQDVGCICSGKIYNDVKAVAGAAEEDDWGLFDNGTNAWEYIEFGYKCQSWPLFYRAFYTVLARENKQCVFDFARIDNLIVTNLGINPGIFKGWSSAAEDEYTTACALIQNHHQRGADELPHRGVKEFGTEQLPFKSFACNSAYFYCMVVAFFLFECFKEDTLEGIVPVRCYANTVRRLVIDIAAKVVKTGRYVILKISKSAMDYLSFDLLWEICKAVRPLPL